MSINASQKILGLVGPKGSGKGTVAKYLQDAYGARAIAFSDIVGDLLDVLHIPRTRNAHIDLAVAIRSAFGDQAFGHAMAARTATIDAPLVIVDGIRFMNDYTSWRGSDNFSLMAIMAEQKTRYERIRARGRSSEENELTREQF